MKILWAAAKSAHRIMNSMFRGLRNEFCVFFQNHQNVRDATGTFGAPYEGIPTTSRNFKIPLDYSEMLRREVAYLGHIVTPEGIKPRKFENFIRHYNHRNVIQNINNFEKMWQPRIKHQSKTTTFLSNIF